MTDVIEQGTQIHSSQIEADDGRLELLRVPFPPHQISKLPKPFKKDSPKGTCKECGGYHGLPAAHLSYVGHAALTDRLLDVDPKWNWHPWKLDNGLPAFDADGGMWIVLEVCGVRRIGYGHAEDKPYMDKGARVKEVIGDALRNAAMRFGAALELWHKGELHVGLPKAELDDAQAKDETDSEITNRLKTCLSASEVQFEWNKLTPEQRRVHVGIKDEMKKKFTDVNDSAI